MQRYFFSLLLTFCTLVCLAQPKVVAHRGYWTTEGSAQNSIASLQKAAEIGCWGSEFDVWMTADGSGAQSGGLVTKVSYTEVAKIFIWIGKPK